MATIDYISDWQKKLRKRLYQQFRTKVTWQALADMLAAQFQDLEDAAQSLLSIVSIDDSEGVQLDQIGALIGQPRLGFVDADYRSYLKARILINRAAGQTEKLYEIFRAAFGDLGYEIGFGGTKSFWLRVSTEITNAQANVGLLFMIAAKDAGARGVLQWLEVPAAQAFTFDVGPGFDTGKLADAADRQR